MENAEDPTNIKSDSPVGSKPLVQLDANIISLFIPLMSWVYDTLEEATDIAKKGMSKKEGLVLLILYKRKGSVKTGKELEDIFRSWNNANHSPRAMEDLGFALGRLLASGAIEALCLPSRAAHGDETPLPKEAIESLQQITLTKDGWFRVGAMRAVLDLRLKVAEERFGAGNEAFLQVIGEFQLPPLTTVIDG